MLATSLGAKFCGYFGHPWHFLIAPVPAPGEKAQWQTETRYPLQPWNLWKEYQNPNSLLGLRFGNETRYILIDIDKGSPYHPANNSQGYKDVLNALEAIGLCRPLVVQSSWSGGLHVYYFLPEPLPTFALACACKCALEDAGLNLRQGHLEQFPNVKAFSKGKPSDYNGHRLPLQDGSFAFNDDLQPLTNDLAYFLGAADTTAAAQDLIALKEAIASAQERRIFKYTPGTGSKASEWKRHLEERIAQGWTEFGQTNNLLKDFATYGILWEALSGDDLVDYVVRTALAAPGYKQFCRHQHEIRSRASEWALCCEGYYTPYCSYPERSRSYKEQFSQASANNIVPFNQVNEERSAQAQDRIRGAVAYLEALRQLPAAVTARGKAICAIAKELWGVGIGTLTLWKESYLALWHPKHYKPETVLQVEPLQLADFRKNLTPPLVARKTAPQLESLEAAPILDSSENLTPPPYMKVEGADWAERPQVSSAQSVPCNNGGESEGGEEVAATDSAATEVIRRRTRLRLEAISHSQKAVRVQAHLSSGSKFSHEERSRLEQAAKFRFYWRSGEPALMAEATEWARANPAALPEALLPGASPLVVGLSTDSPTAVVPQGVAPADSLPLSVGSRVWWDKCPGHCAWANPFTITEIEDGMATLDVYSKPVPLSELRRIA